MNNTNRQNPRTLFLLSSGKSFFEIGKYLEKPLQEYTVAYITTAKKGTDDISYVEERKKMFEEKNIPYQEIDIEAYTLPELKKLLDKKDIIYIEGGNTFYLMNAINKTGCKELLLDNIKNGKTYVGSSAGAYICCPTIEMATWETNKVRDNYGLKDLTGLNSIDFLISVHYEEKHKKVLQEKLQKNKYKLRILKDGQGLLINGEEIIWIGTEEEVIL